MCFQVLENSLIHMILDTYSKCFTPQAILIKKKP